MTEINYIVDDQIRDGNVRSGRVRVAALRDQLEMSIGAGEVSDEAMDLCAALLNDVRRLGKELRQEAPKLDDSELLLKAADLYDELVRCLNELLQQLVSDALGVLPSSLLAVEEAVARIDACVAGPLADLPAA